MSDERIKRDWIFVLILKYTNVVCLVWFPVMIRQLASAFGCISLDDGEGGRVSFLSVDPSMDCDSDRYRMIRNLAIIALTIAVPLMTLMTIAMVWPMRHVLATRTERTCSPILDIFISRWYPACWCVFILELHEFYLYECVNLKVESEHESHLEPRPDPQPESQPEPQGTSPSSTSFFDGWLPCLDCCSSRRTLN